MIYYFSGTGNSKWIAQELARLTGGSHVSQTMLDGAEELLTEAEKFRDSL